MKILVFLALFYLALPPFLCAPFGDKVPRVLDEAELPDGVHNHSDPYRGSRLFQNNKFGLGDIDVSGQIEGDDVAIGSQVDIEVGASRSEAIEVEERGPNVDNLTDVERSRETETHSKSLTDTVLEPLNTVALYEPIQVSMMSQGGGCDQDACQVGVSVGAGVCGVVAGVGGLAAAATTCAATAWFTFGLSCAAAAAAYGVAAAGCTLAGAVGSEACSLCPSGKTPSFEELAKNLNHITHYTWFEKLDTKDKLIITNQGKMIDLQQKTVHKLDSIMIKTQDLEKKIDLSDMLILYGEDVKDLINARRKFQLLTKGTAGIIVNDYRATVFQQEVLGPISLAEDSVSNIFLMLIGGHPMKPESIYSLGGHFCTTDTHKYFLDLQKDALAMMSTALTMKGIVKGMTPDYNKNFNLRVVRATSVFVQNCGCPPDFIRSNRGKLSSLLDQLPLSSATKEENRRKVIMIDDKAMRIKFTLIFEIKNIEPNEIAMSKLRKHAVEDIELVVDIRKGKLKTEIQIHDNADVCVNKEKNKGLKLSFKVVTEWQIFWYGKKNGWRLATVDEVNFHYAEVMKLLLNSNLGKLDVVGLNGGKVDVIGRGGKVTRGNFGDLPVKLVVVSGYQ